MEYNFTSELYYRAVDFVQLRIAAAEDLTKKLGSRLPGVIRQSEKLKVPNQLNSFQSISYFSALIIVNYDNDLVNSEVFNSFVQNARRHGYQGNWRFFLEVCQYFGLEDETSNLKYNDNPDSLFSLPEYFEFLSFYFKEDEIFGNVLQSGVKLLIKNWKVTNRWKADLRKINRPQRKRGYTDKGNLPDFQERFRAKANQEVEYHKLPKYNSLSEVVLFGPPLSEEEIEEINARLLLTDTDGGQ